MRKSERCVNYFTFAKIDAVRRVPSRCSISAETPQDPDFQKIVERPVVRFDFCVKKARPSHSPEVLARPLGPRVGPMDTGRLVTADHGVATRGPRERKGHAWSSITRRAHPPPLAGNALHADSIVAC